MLSILSLWLLFRCCICCLSWGTVLLLLPLWRFYSKEKWGGIAAVNSLLPLGTRPRFLQLFTSLRCPSVNPLLGRFESSSSLRGLAQLSLHTLHTCF